MFVSIFSLTITARSVSMPASFASAVFALTPQDTITSSAGITVPSARRTPSAFSPPSMASICTPVWIWIPCPSLIFLSISPAVLSSWRPISTGASSSTVTSHLDFLSSHAASRPRTPPPMTTACFVSFNFSATFFVSESLRIAMTPSLSAPLIGGMKHSDPSA